MRIEQFLTANVQIPKRKKIHFVEKMVLEEYFLQQIEAVTYHLLFSQSPVRTYHQLDYRLK